MWLFEQPHRRLPVSHPFKVTLGYFTETETQRDGVRVDISNISPAPLTSVELAWMFQVPDPVSGRLRSHRIPFSYAAGVKGQPLGVGQKHTFVIPPEQFFEISLMVQATPPERSCVIAIIDGKETLAVRGEDFEKLVQGCHPKEGRPEQDVSAERVDYLMQLVGAIIELGQAYRIHPPKEVTNDPGILESDEVATKLDGTKWWLRFADSREELLDFRELMVLTYNVFIVKSRMNHQFVQGPPLSGNVSVSVTMAVPHIITKEGVRSLLARLSLEGMQR